jgi:hypothetical protein
MAVVHRKLSSAHQLLERRQWVAAADRRQAVTGQSGTFNRTFSRTFEHPLRPQQRSYARDHVIDAPPTLGSHDHVGGVGVRQHQGRRRPPYRDRSGK